MTLFGVYSFKVYIANLFDPELKVGIKVRYYHHPCYCSGEGEDKKFVIDQIKDRYAEYTIYGGGKIGFPLNIGDEYLEISIDQDMKFPDFDYYIPVGAKAKCYPCELLGPPYKESLLGANIDNEGKPFYHGGIWKVDKSNKDWMLTIQKYSIDPEEDNVTIGDVDI